MRTKFGSKEGLEQLMEYSRSNPFRILYAVFPVHCWVLIRTKERNRGELTGCTIPLAC